MEIKPKTSGDQSGNHPGVQPNQISHHAPSPQRHTPTPAPPHMSPQFAQSEEPQASREMKECPYCAEMILLRAIKCRYCGSDLEGGVQPARPAQATPLPHQPHQAQQSRHVHQFQPPQQLQQPQQPYPPYHTPQPNLGAGGPPYQQGAPYMHQPPHSYHGAPPRGPQQPYQGYPNSGYGAPPMYTSPKSPGLALLLSLIIIGAGQMYNGQVGKGIMMLLMAVFLVPISVGILWLPLAIWSAVDAHNVAKIHNL